MPPTAAFKQMGLAQRLPERSEGFGGFNTELARVGANTLQ